MQNVKKIEFTPRTSGRTKKIENKIVELIKHNKNFMYIGKNKSEMNYVREYIKENPNVPKKNGYWLLPNFMTYNQIHKLKGNHPQHVFCDDISSENLFKLMPELPFMKNVEIYGSIDQYMEDIYKHETEIKELKKNYKERLVNLQKTFDILYDRASANKENYNRLLIDAHSLISELFTTNRKNKQLSKQVDNLTKTKKKCFRFFKELKTIKYLNYIRDE